MVGECGKRQTGKKREREKEGQNRRRAERGTRRAGKERELERVSLHACTHVFTKLVKGWSITGFHCSAVPCHYNGSMTNLSCDELFIQKFRRHLS